MKKKLTVLTGAGISQESGIPTFRDKDNGLWEKYDPEEYATIDAYLNNREECLSFANMLRSLLSDKEPNDFHHYLKHLESIFDVNIITTNIDDLHEKAGSLNIYHLHGSIFEMIEEGNYNNILNCDKDINIGDTVNGNQLRYNIVLFGETPHYLEEAFELVESSDVFLIAGSSLQVYPVSNLIKSATNNIISVNYEDVDYLSLVDFNIRKKATESIIELDNILESLSQ